MSKLTKVKNNITFDQKQEIDSLRKQPNKTFRPVSQGIEKILFKAFPVLDHGFLRVVDYMGDDHAVVQAARVSYGKGTTKVTED